MQHRVRSKLRGLAWVVVAGVLLAGCSFDVSAIAPQRQAHPQPAPEPRHDSGAAAPAQAGSTSMSSEDAGTGATQPPNPPPTRPDPPQPTDMMDARVAPPPDPALDAGIDAAVSVPVEPDEDASVPEPPKPTECDPDLPCVCPHLLAQAVAGGPCLCALTQCAPDDDCRLLWFQSTSYYFCDDQRTWEGGNEHCLGVPNLHLASIQSAAEDAFILANVSDKTWLGGSDRGDEGEWVWLGGDPFYSEGQGALGNAYVNWHSSEPNNDGLSETPADCLLLWYENSVWADGSCGDEHGYVCEVER